MLIETSALWDFTIFAVDGEIGRVSDLQVDDRRWAVADIVVSVGHWPADRAGDPSSGSRRRDGRDPSGNTGKAHGRRGRGRAQRGHASLGVPPAEGRYLPVPGIPLRGGRARLVESGIRHGRSCRAGRDPPAARSASAQPERPRSLRGGGRRRGGRSHRRLAGRQPRLARIVRRGKSGGRRSPEASAPARVTARPHQLERPGHSCRPSSRGHRPRTGLSTGKTARRGLRSSPSRLVWPEPVDSNARRADKRPPGKRRSDDAHTCQQALHAGRHLGRRGDPAIPITSKRAPTMVPIASGLLPPRNALARLAPRTACGTAGPGRTRAAG